MSDEWIDIAHTDDVFEGDVGDVSPKVVGDDVSGHPFPLRVNGESSDIDKSSAGTFD